MKYTINREPVKAPVRDVTLTLSKHEALIVANIVQAMNPSVYKEMFKYHSDCAPTTQIKGLFRSLHITMACLETELDKELIGE